MLCYKVKHPKVVYLQIKMCIYKIHNINVKSENSNLKVKAISLQEKKHIEVEII